MTEAPYPAALTALISVFAETLLFAVTTALSGILTAALETPSTLVSADCTRLTQPTPHVMPVTLSLTVFVSASSALISVGAVLLPVIWSAEAVPSENAGIAAMAQMASSVCVFFISVVWL